MTINRIIRTNVELTYEEVDIIHRAKVVLENVLSAMQDNNCTTLCCSDEFHYDISELEEAVDALEMYEDITGFEE